MIPFNELAASLAGELYTDDITRTSYATDASVYKVLPDAVAYPASSEDLVTLVKFASRYGTGLILRTTGTSLAGQVVGRGIVVDVSKHLNIIIEINTEGRYAWVQPGVVLDELNAILAEHGLFFGPETSTANRCMIGGMLGNNACGLHSLVYGSTREHTLAVEAILSDGCTVVFDELDHDGLKTKLSLPDLEGQIYRVLDSILSDPDNQNQIRQNYPKKDIPRRNTGYALDLLLDSAPYSENSQPFNISKILAGSEGTLALFTAIKIKLVKLPPPYKALVCGHFNSIRDALLANIIALKHNPSAVELMDSTILECTHANKEQEQNRFFVQGNPRAILIIECNAADTETLDSMVEELIKALESSGLGYAYPVVYGNDTKKVWNLRKAGLGLLGNLPGDARSVTLIEDTAVDVNDLPEYIGEIEALFEKYGMTCVYHAHVGTGELHLRPVLNLKSPDDVVKFRQIATETVAVVKKYRGSFSGEHGDGRLRSEFIPMVLGEHVARLHEEIKLAFDPLEILNPGKIVRPVKMDQSFRVTPGMATPDIDTIFNWDSTNGVVRAAEKCNGSGDCRKSHLIGGTMCPSYQATRDEKNTTRARANVLREYLYARPGKNRYDHPEIYEILDLCLSCKACKSECPSSVDMAKHKAEFLQHWYDAHGAPLRSVLIGRLPEIYRLTEGFQFLINWILGSGLTKRLFHFVTGFSSQRTLPPLSRTSLQKWQKKNLLSIQPSADTCIGSVVLFTDEFTNFHDAHIGESALRLLTSLGYRVIITRHQPSARTYLSKGFLRRAKKIAEANTILLHPLVNDETPLIGGEPSAILSFRDEYPELVDKNLYAKSHDLARQSFMIDEFIAREMKAGRIKPEQFTKEHCEILLHGHCQQKAVASTQSTLFMLSFPENYTCSEIPSGCCGMAGSFGMEKEHYDLSMAVGELVLFPAVRNADEKVLIAAPGTSCRHQIHDGTGKKALHPVEILYKALRH